MKSPVQLGGVIFLLVLLFSNSSGAFKMGEFQTDLIFNMNLVRYLLESGTYQNFDLASLNEALSKVCALLSQGSVRMHYWRMKRVDGASSKRDDLLVKAAEHGKRIAEVLNISVVKFRELLAFGASLSSNYDLVEMDEHSREKEDMKIIEKFALSYKAVVLTKGFIRMNELMKEKAIELLLEHFAQQTGLNASSLEEIKAAYNISVPDYNAKKAQIETKIHAIKIYCTLPTIKFTPK